MKRFTPIPHLTEVLILSLAAGLLLASCTDPLQGGKGTLSIDLEASLNQASATKAVVADFTKYATKAVVSVTGADGISQSQTVTNFTLTPSLSFSDIAAGSCTASLIVYKDETQIGSGSTGLTITAGGTTTMTVPLAYTQIGSGSFSLSITWPSTSASTISASLMDGTSISTSITGSTAIISNSSISSGTHELMIVFYKGSTIVGYGYETVTVWDNVASTYWLDSSGTLQTQRNFSASELYGSTTSLSDLSITGLYDQTQFAFDASTIDYKDSPSILVTRSSINVVLTAYDGQLIEYRWYPGLSSSNPWTQVNSGTLLSLNMATSYANGRNVLEVTVTAPNRVDTRTYTIWFYKAYTLSFDLKDGFADASQTSTWIAPQTIIQGDKAASISSPSRNGFTFAGWYSDPSFTTPWNLGSDAISADTTLYAKWTGTGTVTVNTPATSGTTLTLTPSSTTVDQGFGSFFSPAGTPFSTISSGWTWYVDGTVDSTQTGPTYILSSTSTSSMSGTYSITGKVTYQGVTYSGSASVTVSPRQTLNLTASSTATSSGSLSYTLNAASGMTYSGGYFYITSVSRSCIFRSSASAMATLEVFAGTYNTSGNTDGTGTTAQFSEPLDICSDGSYLYVLDRGNHNIRKVNITTKAVTTLAGSGTAGYAEGTGTAAKFNTPFGLCIVGSYLYICDTMNYLIRKVNASTGEVSTLAGTGTSGMEAGLGTAASFTWLHRICSDGTYLYASDSTSLRKIAISDGTVSNSTLSFPYYTQALVYDGTSLFVEVPDEPCNGGHGTIYKVNTNLGTSSQICTSSSFSYPQALTTDGARLYTLDYQQNSVFTISN